MDTRHPEARPPKIELRRERDLYYTLSIDSTLGFLVKDTIALCEYLSRGLNLEDLELTGRGFAIGILCSIVEVTD